METNKRIHLKCPECHQKGVKTNTDGEMRIDISGRGWCVICDWYVNPEEMKRKLPDVRWRKCPTCKTQVWGPSGFIREKSSHTKKVCCACNEGVRYDNTISRKERTNIMG